MKFNFENVKKVIKKAAPAIAATVVGGSAMAQQGPSIQEQGDKLFASRSGNTVEHATAGHENPKLTSADFNKAERVTKQPEGSVVVAGPDGKKYFMKTLPGSKVKEVKSGSVGGGQKYKKPVTNVLHKKEHVPKHHPNVEVSHFKDPSVQLFYMEPEEKNIPEVDPYAAFGKMGEPIYAPGGHIAAEIFYATRESHSITDGGMVDTQKGSALVRFRNDHGFTGLTIVIPAEDVQKYFGVGNHFQSQALLEELKTKASKSNENKIHSTTSSRDVAQGE
jgi:hypothetical protein